ncbi:MAG: 2OG-Fe(II) oxygenase family protein [Pseudomonadales bacterium]
MATQHTSAVPTIRFDHLQTAGETRALDAACREWGFFQLTHHGIDAAARAQTLSALRRFFDQPPATKRLVERSAANPWGFYDRELTKNTRDWKEIFDVGEAEHDGPLAGSEPQWPEGLDGFRNALEDHRNHCERIAARLLRAIADALGSPADVLADAFRPTHTSFLRLNFYPVCSRPEAPEGIQAARDGHLGINHHTDAGALTVLMQDDVNSLQVYRRGRWHPIEPQPGSLIINIGDVVQVWSNDRYPAPLHRVLANPTRERVSAAYFYNPAASATYAPLPGLGTPRYHPISWGAFRSARAAGDYADAGEEIQVAHFRR